MFHCGFQNGEFLILSFHLHLLAVNDVIFQKEEEGSGDLNSEKVQLISICSLKITCVLHMNPEKKNWAFVD